MNHLILDDLHRIEVGAEVEVMIQMKEVTITKKVITVMITREMHNPEVSHQYLQKTKFRILINQIQDIMNAKIYQIHHLMKLLQNSTWMKTDFGLEGKIKRRMMLMKSLRKIKQIVKLFVIVKGSLLTQVFQKMFNFS